MPAQTIIYTAPAGGGKSTDLQNTMAARPFRPAEMRILTYVKALGNKWATWYKKQFGESYAGNATSFHAHAFSMLGLDKDEDVFFVPEQIKFSPIYKLWVNTQLRKDFKITAEQKQELDAWEKEYKTLKAGRLEFLDFITEVLRRGLQDPFTKLLVVDEIQDLSYLFFEYIERVFPNANKVFAGDLNQLIYTFAGADYDFIVDYIKKCKIITDNRVFRHGERIANFGFQILRSDKKNPFIQDNYIIENDNPGIIHPKINSLMEVDFDPNKKYLILGSEHQIIKEQGTNILDLIGYSYQYYMSGGKQKKVDNGDQRNPRNIQLGTFWRNKGLQFEVVIILLNMGELRYQELKQNPEFMREAIRVLYVGVTRATHELYLVDGNDEFSFSEFSEIDLETRKKK